MKRTALLFLTAIYLLSSLGMSVDRFYCCGKLASVSYSIGAAENGDKSAKKDNCCDHQKQSFRIKDSHFSAASISINHPAPAIVPSFISLVNEPVVSILHTQIVYKGNAPPGHSDIPVYTLNCAYRI
jgi:hypothetical protein